MAVGPGDDNTHTINVGTDLNARKITCDIPVLSTDIISLKYIAKVNDSNYIAENKMTVEGQTGECSVGYYHYNDANYIFYLKNSSGVVVTNLTSFTLPDDFGVVTEIDETANLYDYLLRNCHEKVYVICEDFCKEESLSKEAIKDEVRGYGVPTNSVIGFDGTEDEIPGGYEKVNGGESPIGIVLPYAGTTAPIGYLLCDGSAVSRTTYADLFDVIGTNFGTGDGSTTFNLPNLKGKVPVGLDTSDNDFNSLGKTGGEKTHTLTIDETPNHPHGVLGSSGTGGWQNQFAFGNNENTKTIETNPTGGGESHNNLQPYIVLNYIIKY